VNLAKLADLADAPLLLALLLTIPLWWYLDNVVVALGAALLLAFLVSMAKNLIVLRTIQATPEGDSGSDNISCATPAIAVDVMSAASFTILPCPAVPCGLPQLDAQALAHAQAMQAHLRQCIAASGGFLPFAQWMQEALYAPGLGYYAANATQFGAQGGDFTTAPELTPLFGRSLAVQVAQVLRESGSLHVLEFGAGSGALAASVIPMLRELGIEPHYHILEVSPALRERQHTRLEPLQARVQWLDTLPGRFMGCVVANEVLDAMPATLFRWDEDGQLMELGVVSQDPPALQRAFALAQRPASQPLRDRMAARMPPLPGYRSECNPQAEAWVGQLGTWLHAGAVLLIDYGFSQREYYHPQRADGTLMCHLRHRAHADPLIYPGLQDITTHVDFTAMADAALTGGLQVLGYTTQARFLMNCGIVTQLAQAQSGAANTKNATSTLSTPVPGPQELAQQSAAVQTLLSEAEMGELFKVLALGRGIDAPLLGFTSGDRSHSL